MSQPSVILSGFADEAALSKTAVEQLAVFAALGFRYYSLRFVDMGNGVRNVMKLEDSEIEQLKKLNETYGLKVATLGSPLGKVKIKDFEDGTTNVYVPFKDYLEEQVTRAIALANRFETKLIRGFSFYPPKGENPKPYMAQAIDQIGKIADACKAAGLVYGLEIEPNLTGQDGETMKTLYDGVNADNVVLIFDGGNIACQNKGPDRVFEEYMQMRDGIGWVHIKDYKIEPGLKWEGHVDEERLENFVPADIGDAGHLAILKDFASVLEEKNAKMKALGAPGVFLDLEPHVRGGGQFGGFSGPDGMGIALRALCRVLDEAGIGYAQREFGELKAERDAK